MSPIINTLGLSIALTLTSCYSQAPIFEVGPTSGESGNVQPSVPNVQSESEDPTDNAPSDPSDEEGKDPIAGLSGPATGTFQANLTVSAPGQDGNYSPRRLEAFWITDMNDQHIVTLSANPGIRPQHLRQWRKANGGELDGFSGATITNYSGDPKPLNWNLQDKNGNTVMMGSYKLWMEITESNTNDNSQSGDEGYEFHSVVFKLGTEPSQENDANNNSFQNISISHTP